MKKFIIGLIVPLSLAMLLLLFGCSREIESPEPDYGPAEAPPVPNMLKVTYLNEAVRLSWQSPDTLAGMTFNVYYSDDTEGVYTSWEKTAAFSSVITGLIPGRPYYFRVAAVTVEGLEGYKSEPITAGIGVLTLTVNGGDIYTSSRNISINFRENRGINLHVLRKFLHLCYDIIACQGIPHVNDIIRFSNVYNFLHFLH